MSSGRISDVDVLGLKNRTNHSDIKKKLKYLMVVAIDTKY